jgi:hypothetical protein
MSYIKKIWEYTLCEEVKCPLSNFFIPITRKEEKISNAKEQIKIISWITQTVINLEAYILKSKRNCIILLLIFP